MMVKQIEDEWYQDYKVPSMLVAMTMCNWKCCNEAGLDKSVCQNSALAQLDSFDIDPYRLFHRYCGNPISKAIVFGGLEPMLQTAEIIETIKVFRLGGCQDDIVIYTGYYPNELVKELNRLREYPNIVVKFGRFIPGSATRYDDVLGVMLESENQYAERIS